MNKYVNSCSVYRNGEERYHGARILLNKRSHLDMEKVCSYSYTYVRTYVYVHRSHSICMIIYVCAHSIFIMYVCMYIFH